MNIEKAKAELQAAMTGPAGKKWGYGPAVETLLNELAAKDGELQEYRKAAVHPVYQLVNDDWYDTEKEIYEEVVKSGGRGRIVYGGPQPLKDAERAELLEYRKAVQPLADPERQELR